MVVPPTAVTDPIAVLIAIAMGVGIVTAGYGLILVAMRFTTAHKAGEFDRTAAQLGIVLAAVTLILSAAEVVLALTVAVY